MSAVGRPWGSAAEVRAMVERQDVAGPVLDANGDPVPGAPEGSRAWFAGRVPAARCPHYIAVSEARCGFERCERCGS